MICDICGQDGVKIRTVSRNYGKGNNLFIIENIPVHHCRKCGESYLTATILHEIERIKLHKQSLARKRSVAVAEFC